MADFVRTAADWIIDANPDKRPKLPRLLAAP